MWTFGIPWMMPVVADILLGFRQSNFSGKVIVVALFVGSIMVWTVMIVKLRHLRAARLASERFLAAYRKESHPVLLFRKDRTRLGEGPLRTVYERACQALGTALDASDGLSFDLFSQGAAVNLSDRHVKAVQNAVDRTLADQSLVLETHLGLLAMATNVAPFLGLLGTVWGVMESFGSISSAGAAMLSDVAPGISGALLTTVVGLLVALPSSIGYNILTDQLRRLTVLMDNFAQEFVADLERLQLR